MGIIGLWDVIKNEDHSVPIAQLAEDHFKRHGRPLRVAVDEPDWRFNNLTPQQVYTIRENSNEPAFQGIEKSMFYRICRLLTLNVQLLFVFDGPGKPWKHGKRGGGKINYEERRLLKELLDYFRIPHHEAPGEAEAECARLQQLGLVDAVFSQDSDTLMFGCSVLIRDDRVAKEKGNRDRSKENTKKSGTSVRVVYGRDIREKHNFDREGLVLFVMLCGGDYHKGLRNCGSAMAIAAVRAGLGTSLCQCTTRADCAVWRTQLFDFFLTRKGRKPDFDPAFPDIKTLEKYNRPKVSTDDQLQNLRGLRNGWNVLFDELKLLEVTSSRFNIWGKLYMNWVGPVLLTRFLVARDPTSPKEHLHQIKLKKRHTKKDSTHSQSPPLMRSLAFSPFGLTTLQQKDFEGERAGYWTSKLQDPFDPDHTVNAEIPTYLLQRLLPSSVLDPPDPKTLRKRKRQAEDDAESSNMASVIAIERELSTCQNKRANSRRASASPSHLGPAMGGRSCSPDTTPSRHSTRTRPIRSEEVYITLLSDSEEDTTLLQRRSSVIDLGDSPGNTDNENEDEALNRAIQLSLQKPDAPIPTVSPSQTNHGNNLDGVARREWSDTERSSLVVPHRTDSVKKSIVGSSNSYSSRLDSALSSVVREGHLQASSITSPTAAVTVSPARHPKSSSGSSASEVRAARLRYFTTSEFEDEVTPKQAMVSMQLAPLSTPSYRNTEPRSLPEDIETIDLT